MFITSYLRYYNVHSLHADGASDFMMGGGGVFLLLFIPGGKRISYICQEGDSSIFQRTEKGKIILIKASWFKRIVHYNFKFMMLNLPAS